MNTKKTSIIRRWWLFCIALLVALIAFLPAQVVLYSFPVMGLDASKAIISGPWWNTYLRYGQVAGHTFSNIHVRWQPKPLDMRWSNWHITWQSPMVTGHSDVTWLTSDDVLQLDNLQLQVDLSHIPLPPLQAFGLLGTQGKVSMQVSTMAIDLQPAAPQADWQYWLSKVVMPQPLTWQTDPLWLSMPDQHGGVLRTKLVNSGHGQLQIEPAESVKERLYTLQVVFDQAPTLVKGQVSLQAGVLVNDLEVMLTQHTPSIVTQLLPMVAQKNTQGSYSISSRWTL
jgi:hypothetical protein